METGPSQAGPRPIVFQSLPSKFQFFLDFHLFSPDFHTFFVEKLFRSFCIFSVHFVFPRPKLFKTPRKYLSYTSQKKN